MIVTSIFIGAAAGLAVYRLCAAIRSTMTPPNTNDMTDERWQAYASSLMRKEPTWKIPRAYPPIKKQSPPITAAPPVPPVKAKSPKKKRS